MQICTSYEDDVVAESNLTRPMDDFLNCLGCLYDFSVLSDDWTTTNIDPWKLMAMKTIYYVHMWYMSHIVLGMGPALSTLLYEKFENQVNS